jgi:hypothetical protein
VADERALLDQPWVGASWEGYAIEQAIGHLTASGTRFQAYWFRTSDGHELDLVLELGADLWAIEFKLTSSPGPDDLRRLGKTADLIGPTRRVLVSQVSEPTGDGRRDSTNLDSFLSLLEAAQK